MRCKEFQCRAYKGREGQWHSAADDSVLEVVEIVLRFDLLAATPVS